jgi:hypothetical protein
LLAEEMKKALLPKYLFPKMVSYNVMTFNTPTRVSEVLGAMRENHVNLAGLQGTRRVLLNKAKGYDSFVQDGWLVVSFGRKFAEETSAGIAIIVDLDVFEIDDLVRIWAPVNSLEEAAGRVGVVRLKRNDFAIAVICAYPPPLDSRGAVRPVTHMVYKTIKHALQTKGILPSRYLPFPLIDANAHVGLTYDRTARGWFPCVCVCVRFHWIRATKTTK